MAEYRYLTRTISVGATASYTDIFIPEKPLKFKRLMVSERAGAALNNVHMQILIAGVPFIRETIPLSVVGSTYDRALPLEFETGGEIRIKITNNTSTAITLDLVFEVE